MYKQIRREEKRVKLIKTIKQFVFYTLLFFFFLLGTSEMLPAAYHEHDAGFIKKSLIKLPDRFKKHINYNYANTFNKKGRYAANINLLNLKESLINYDMAKDDDEIIEQARLNAKLCQHKNTLDHKRDVAKARGINPPVTENEAGEANRLNCEHWWRRQLRKTHGRNVEKTAIQLGMVSKAREIYASNESLERRQQQNRRNTHLLETLAATNEEGQTYTLKELSDLTTSNPELRRNELMTRIRGFEELANENKYAGMFYTITCPSRFHKKTTAKNGGTFDNPKYAGLTPREAQAYLSSVWARTRAAFNRAEIKPYGFRVAEPQHDGTPHWHLLLFLPEGQQAEATKIFREYALQDSPNEKGAQKYRFTPIRIDPDKGTAAGYIAKYIAKNIDGYAIDSDLFGNDPIKAAARVQAWASTWGIRQFQQIGGASVTVYRELRRLEHHEDGVIEEAREAADAGDWAGYNKAMARADIKPLYLQEFNKETGEIKQNRYGDVSQGQVIGLENNGVIYVTRFHTWTVEKIQNDNKGVAKQDSGCGSINGGKYPCNDRGRGRTTTQHREGDNRKGRAYNAGNGRGINRGQHLAHVLDFYKSTRKIKAHEHRAHVDKYKRGLMLGKRSAAPWTCVNNCTEKLKT